MSAGRICCRCNRAILSSDYKTISGESMSGARPDMHAHRWDDPQCVPIRASAL